MLLVYLIGGLIYWDQIWLAFALGIIVTVLLALRSTLHRLVARIKREDIYAALKLAVVSAVVLPLFPNEAYGPLGVLNPFRIWLMVVLVSAVGFSGYVGINLLGPCKGIGLTALLGGLISSTAVTLDFSQRSKETPSLGRYLALGIVLASTTMYPIIVLQVLAFNSALAERVWLPMALLAGLGAGSCVILWRTAGAGEREHGICQSLSPLVGDRVRAALWGPVVGDKSSAGCLGRRGGLCSQLPGWPDRPGCHHALDGPTGGRLDLLSGSNSDPSPGNGG